MRSSWRIFPRGKRESLRGGRAVDGDEGGGAGSRKSSALDGEVEVKPYL